MVKKGKETKLINDNSFRVKYGTIDCVDMKSIYIDINSWIIPKNSIEKQNELNSIGFDLKKKIYNTINTKYFKNYFIVDFDVALSGLKEGKKSFMNLNVVVYPKTLMKFNSEIVKKEITHISDNIISELKSKNFEFYGKK